MNIENKKQFATILLAVGLGLVAAFLTSQYVQKNVQRQTKKLAKQYQKKNSVLVQELELMKREMKKIATNQAALAKRQQQQKVVKAAPSKKPKAAKGSFSLKIPPGKRAYTIKIDTLSAVGGLISSGDVIDIIGHLKIPKRVGKKATQKITTVLFQNVQVLAVGTIFENITDRKVYKTQHKARSLQLTLAVTPEEVGLLTFAQDNGKLQLSLRSPAEQETQLLQVASWEALSDFVLDRQGTELVVPKTKAQIETLGDTDDDEEVRPFIEIFKSGRSSN